MSRGYIRCAVRNLFLSTLFHLVGLMWTVSKASNVKTKYVRVHEHRKNIHANFGIMKKKVAQTEVAEILDHFVT